MFRAPPLGLAGACSGPVWGDNAPIKAWWPSAEDSHIHLSHRGKFSRCSSNHRLFPLFVMYAPLAIFLVAVLSVATAAPSGYLGHGAALAGPILGPAALAGPINGPSALAGPVVGPARISGAVDGGAVVTGSVAGPSVVSGSIAGHTAVVGPALGYGAPALGWPAWNGKPQ